MAVQIQRASIVNLVRASRRRFSVVVEKLDGVVAVTRAYSLENFFQTIVLSGYGVTFQ